MKDFLQVRDNGSQCVKWFHFEFVIFLLHGLVILNSNNFCVGTIVHQVETCSSRVNVTFSPVMCHVLGEKKKEYDNSKCQGLSFSLFVSQPVCLPITLSVCLSTSNGTFASMSFACLVPTHNRS